MPTDWKANSMSGELYSSLISSRLQSCLGAVACTASLITLLLSGGGGGALLGETEEKVSLTGVLNDRTVTHDEL